MNDEVLRQRNVDRVRAFFQAERALDFEAWVAAWADNAVRRSPFAPPGVPSEQRGKTAIGHALRTSFEQALRLTVSEEIFPTTDPALVIARASTSGMMRNGIPYQNEVVAFFRFAEDGRIVEWTGYINPLPIVELMNARASLSDANSAQQNRTDVDTPSASISAASPEAATRIADRSTSLPVESGGSAASRPGDS